MESEASIAICSDSQAALMALRSSKVTSSLAAETVKALTELSMFNSVRLLWIPGHSDIPGNETADQYAKQAASQDFVGPERALGIPTTKIRSAAQLWANAQQRNLWQTSSGCRQAKMFLHGPDKKLSRYALSHPRRKLKILVGLLTGHIALNRHLTVMKIQEDPLCSRRDFTPLFWGNVMLICKLDIPFLEHT